MTINRGLKAVAEAGHGVQSFVAQALAQALEVSAHGILVLLTRLEGHVDELEERLDVLLGAEAGDALFAHVDIGTAADVLAGKVCFIITLTPLESVSTLESQGPAASFFTLPGFGSFAISGPVLTLSTQAASWLCWAAWIAPRS